MPAITGVGLSPRVRGNQWTCGRTYRGAGSIPARAGEPWRRPCRPSPESVYPRACGGTTGDIHLKPPGEGLSPRVRGNLFAAPADRRVRGSIPARAGEPHHSRPQSPTTGVYPRACGGTDRAATPERLDRGLSPRVRGNLTDTGGIGMTERSIPARAGEPSADSGFRTHRRVYPRACGGTSPASSLNVRQQGLSPRVRGNRFGRSNPPGAERSIPARAGEPRGWRCR